MQTKYEQITELRETATLINQLEFKIQFNSNSIEQMTKYNSHKENTDLINELTAITDKLKADLQKHKEVFDLLLSNIKPYQSKEVERELKVGGILVCHTLNDEFYSLTLGKEYPISEVVQGRLYPIGFTDNIEHNTLSDVEHSSFHWSKLFTLKS